MAAQSNGKLALAVPRFDAVDDSVLNKHRVQVCAFGIARRVTSPTAWLHLMNIEKTRIATRLLMVAALFVVTALAAMASGAWQKSRASDTYGDLVRERSPGYVAQARSQRHFQISAKHINRMLLEAENPAKADELWKLVEFEFGNFETRTAQFEKGNPGQSAMATAVREKHRLIEQHARDVYNAVKAGRAQQGLDIVRTKLDPAIDQLRDLMVEQVNGNVKLLSSDSKNADEALASAQSAIWVAMVCGLLLAASVGWWVIRSIIKQLGGEPAALQAMAQAVARGDLSDQAADHAFNHAVSKSADGSGKQAAIHRVPANSLMASMLQMREKLRDLVTQVRQGSENVASASAEIEQGNLDLSSRTENQVSALQTTASSMEQLSTTVRLNADNALQASQLAQSAADVAVKGGAVVARVVDTMKGINDSSAKIADIITVIDSIAFQTNILALNAAVEAARAGDQGRGFAVVASEVRSLAGRSAEAAKQIKQLISTSVERVGQGSKLVDQAGVTMKEVVSSIRRVTEIMSEISTASAEQSQGVAQVGDAVAKMDNATQQNAALVEETAAAAGSLRTQATQLVTTVAAFKLQPMAAVVA